MAKEDGFIKISRKLDDWEHADNLAMIGFWIRLLLLANWEDKKRVKRGEIITTIPILSSMCGCSDRTVMRYLDKLRKSGEIKTSTNHRNTKIQIVNYEMYQSGKNVTTDVMTAVTTGVTTDVMTAVTSHPYKRNQEEKKGRKEEEKRVREKSENDHQPTADEVDEYAKAEGLSLNAADFVDYYSVREWKIQGEPIRDWRALVRRWSRKEEEFKQQKSGSRGKQKDVLPQYYNPDPERKPESNERMTGSELEDLKALLASTRK